MTAPMTAVRPTNRGHAAQAAAAARREAAHVRRILAEGGTLDDGRVYLNTAGTPRLDHAGGLQRGTWTIDAVRDLLHETAEG